VPVAHPEDRRPALGADAGPTDAPALEVEGLSYAYPDGRQALDSVTFSVRWREKVALVGPNGAGKSTFLLHVIGILRGSGAIRVDGLPIEKANLPLIRSRVGMVFQNPDDQLFSPTVFEDVAFGPLHMGLDEEEVRRRVGEALGRVGMPGFADRLSHHLSVGEKKRAAIATVLSMSPGILVLDEPTAGLDPRARRHLIRLLYDLPITMLVATHDMHMVTELFPRVVVMAGGRIVADDATARVFADVGFLEAHGLEQP
jgi:cobalt transport protein ATP-binding subunit